jgi:hypothetical protein
MKKCKDAKPYPVPRAPDVTRAAWAHAHRKQRPQEKVVIHKGGKGNG